MLYLNSYGYSSHFMVLLLFEEAAFCVQYFLYFKQSWLLPSNLAGYLQDWAKHGFYIFKWLKKIKMTIILYTGR